MSSFAAFFITSTGNASLQNELRFQTFHYASDDAPTFYLSNKSLFETEHFLGKVNLYYESGLKGIFSFDPDPLRYTLYTDGSKKTLLWFGREHPLNLTRGFTVEPYSALGSIWTQNQTESLDPRVSGWLSLGLVQEIATEWKLTAAYSPLFLPNFGPSLGFTERGELNPSRFARLPPSNAVTGGVNLPIRYQLQLGQLSELLLRHQGFLGMSQNSKSFHFDVYAFTAPKPDPVATTDATLAVNASEVNAKVYINPQFPREYWSGMRAQFKSLPFEPALELVQNLLEWKEHTASAIAYLDTPEWSSFVIKRAPRSAFGVLSHFQAELSAPALSDFLIFIQVPFALSESLTLHTFLEATLFSMRESIYWLNELEYQVQSGFSLTLAMRLLSGKAHSYFGDWRNEDSLSAGMRWVW
ncbi:MAG: hypothetical protein H7333_06490 [Bdellovibrionales bacterium]|nr:hypothetical protein [Oligoflexia bacterium]